MVKRPNRLPPIEHERRQLEALKGMEPNTTPVQYHALSNGLVDVAISALDIVVALEASGKPNFGRLYDLVDGLGDLVDDDHTADPEPNVQAERPLVPAARVDHAPVPTSVPLPLQGKGVTALKSTIIGRPDTITVHGDTVVLDMTYMPKPGSNGQYSLPKGVPAPQETSTPIRVYVGAKQFNKVKAQLDNPEDALIIEGAISQVVDGVLTVYASNITSKLIQAAKTAEQKAATQPNNA